MRRAASHSSSRLFDIFIVRSWWVLLLFFLSLFFFDQGMHQKFEEKEYLCEKIEHLSHIRDQLLIQKETLECRLKSQGDWRFEELVLKERLGVKEKDERRTPYITAS